MNDTTLNKGFSGALPVDGKVLQGHTKDAVSGPSSPEACTARLAGECSYIWLHAAGTPSPGRGVPPASC